jgi:lantibiotic modifying enzyme
VKDGPDGLKWTKMQPPRKEAYPVQWCHGSPGIGLFFVTMRDRFGKREYQRALDACIASNRRTGRTARGSGCQCHGVGGNAELFIEAWRSRKDPALLATAREWAADLVADGRLRTTIGSWSYGPGYMVGMAGVGRFFLRLAAPEKLALPFTVWR